MDVRARSHALVVGMNAVAGAGGGKEDDSEDSDEESLDANQLLSPMHLVINNHRYHNSKKDNSFQSLSSNNPLLSSLSSGGVSDSSAVRAQRRAARARAQNGNRRRSRGGMAQQQQQQQRQKQNQHKHPPRPRGRNPAHQNGVQTAVKKDGDSDDADCESDSSASTLAKWKEAHKANRIRAARRNATSSDDSDDERSAGEEDKGKGSAAAWKTSPRRRGNTARGTCAKRAQTWNAARHTYQKPQPKQTKQQNGDRRAIKAKAWNSMKTTTNDAGAVQERKQASWAKSKVSVAHKKATVARVKPGIPPRRSDSNESYDSQPNGSPVPWVGGGGGGVTSPVSVERKHHKKKLGDSSSSVLSITSHDSDEEEGTESSAAGYLEAPSEVGKVTTRAPWAANNKFQGGLPAGSCLRLGRDDVSSKSSEGSLSVSDLIKKNSLRSASSTSHQGPGKVLFQLLNFDPGDEASMARFDNQLAMATMRENPQTCGVRYKFDVFETEIYPFSMLCALGATVETLRACSKAYPQALEVNDASVGTPLHYACAYSRASKRVLKWLMGKDDVMVVSGNGKEQLPLHLATKAHSPVEHVICLLREYKDSLKETDASGMTALHHACNSHEADVEVVDLLARKYRRACVLQNEEGCTPLHLAIAKEAPFPIASVLVDAEQDAVQVCDAQGNFPLHTAVQVANVDLQVVKLLVDACSDSLIQTNSNGEVPVVIAKRHFPKDFALHQMLIVS